MWSVKEVQVVPRSYSLQSVEHADFSLRADGETLVNMLCQVEWGDGAVQVELCTDCGITGCKSGGYVSIRALADAVVFAPAARAYLPANGRAVQYEAPVWMFDPGAPMFSRAAWNELKRANEWLPSFESPPPLTWQDALLIAQFEAPRGWLGFPGEAAPAPLSGKVRAVEPALPQAQLDRLGNLDTWLRPAGTKLVLRPAAETEVFSVALDESGRRHPLFARADEAFGLYLRPGFVAFPEPGRPKLTVVGQ